MQVVGCYFFLVGRCHYSFTLLSSASTTHQLTAVDVMSVDAGVWAGVDLPCPRALDTPNTSFPA